MISASSTAHPLASYERCLFSRHCTLPVVHTLVADPAPYLPLVLFLVTLACAQTCLLPHAPMELSYKRLAGLDASVLSASDAAPRYAVLLLHGYGANKDDLIPIGRELLGQLSGKQVRHTSIHRT